VEIYVLNGFPTSGKFLNKNSSNVIKIILYLSFLKPKQCARLRAKRREPTEKRIILRIRKG
jgi:hypothetical protein